MVSLHVCPGGEDRTPGHTLPTSRESGVLHLLMTAELFREKREDHSAAAVEGGRVMLLGGRDSPLTGEITGEYLWHGNGNCYCGHSLLVISEL